MIIETMKCDVPGCRHQVRCPDDGSMPPGWGKVIPHRGRILHICPDDVDYNEDARVDNPI